MAYLPNIDALKDMSALNIDMQCIQQVGSQVFNYNGDITPDYQAMCAYLVSAINTMIGDAQALLSLVPVFDNK